MQSIKLISVVSLVLVTSGTSLAKGWRGLIPLHSNRQDVERLLSTPNDSYYDLKDEIVYIDFSSGACQADGPDSYRVPANIVTRIMVIPKSEPHLDSLGIDLSKYKKKVDGEIQDHIFYYDEEAGECVEAFRNRVESITYTPATSAASLRCYASLEDWMTANNIACVLPATKFDEFNALSLAEERRRLKSIAIQLKSASPMSRGWIIVYGDKKAGRAAAVRRASRIKNFLVKDQRLAPGRVLTAVGPNVDEPRVELWISVVGHALPEPLGFVPKSDNKRN